MASRLSPLDSSFLWLERGSMLAHVAGLQIFSLPGNAPADFLQQLVAELRRPLELRAPWNRRLKPSPLRGVAPAWISDNDIDMDYHVRHLALPRPGGERELGVMVSRLHGIRLDRRRPLWECHVIEGLENGRFAIYTKIHHALVDGVTAMRLMTESLSEQAGATPTPPWSFGDRPGQMREPKPSASLPDLLRAAPGLARAVTRLGRAALTGSGELAVPFSAPRSPLNVPITPQRRFATQQFELARIKAVGQATGTTVNDVVMALSSSALRRYLREGGSLPRRPLVAAVPISLRPAGGDAAAGNNVAIVLAALASDVADPRLRLATIRRNMQRVKAHVGDLSTAGMKAYTTAQLAPFSAQLLSGLAGRSRPFFNLTISNVPGPQKPLYLGGARLEAIYPVSNPFDGQALNITCTSYAGTLNFGFCGCRDSLRHMQRIAVYAGEALSELEAALKLTPEPARRAA